MTERRNTLLRSIVSFCLFCTYGGGLYPFLVKMHKNGGPFYANFREIRGPGARSTGDDFRRNLELPGTRRPQSAESGAIDRRNS